MSHSNPKSSVPHLPTDEPKAKVAKEPVHVPEGPLPRMVDQSSRSELGTTRFKILGRGAGESGRLPIRYVLVESGPKAKEAAESFYLRSVGGTSTDPLIVTKLAD